MADTIYVDMSALLALINAADPHHRKAVLFLEQAQVRSLNLVSIPDVLPVIAHALRHTAGAVRAAAAVTMLRRSELIRFDPLTEEDMEEAWRIFAVVKARDWTFAESGLVAVMNRVNAEMIFSFNPGYRDYGFRVIPEDTA